MKMQMIKFHAKSMAHLKLGINSSKGEYCDMERNNWLFREFYIFFSILLSEIDASNVHLRDSLIFLLPDFHESFPWSTEWFLKEYKGYIYCYLNLLILRTKANCHYAHLFLKMGSSLNRFWGNQVLLFAIDILKSLNSVTFEINFFT